MNDFAAALSKAFALIGELDAELLEIVVLSLSVSLLGSACAFLITNAIGISAECRKRTHAAPQTASLFDSVVRYGERTSCPSFSPKRGLE
jgi:ABC-type tungstate transport system substrate-binding protein